jgi:hypothetical protein
VPDRGRTFLNGPLRSHFFFAAAFLAGAFFAGAAAFLAGAFFAAALAILILPLSERCSPNQIGLKKYAHVPDKC